MEIMNLMVSFTLNMNQIMKKVFASLFLVLGMGVLSAQTSITPATANDVPADVKIAFKNEFKSTQVIWSANAQNYVAKWDADNTHKTAYYAKGDKPALVRVETDVQVSSLSEGAQNSAKQFTSNGSSYSIVRTFQVSGWAGVAEGIEYDNGHGNYISVFFDASGNMVKREITK